MDDIVKINHDVRDLNSMMKIMDTEVDKQGQTINIIEEHVTKADEHVNAATNDIKETRKIQKSKNKWLWIGLAAVTVVAVVLLLIFVL